jgi:tellurite resistance protein TerC
MFGDIPFWMWGAFGVIVATSLAIDLFANRKAHAPSFKEACAWTVVWIAMACAFGAGVWHYLGAQAGQEYFTAYVLEKSLSVDNLFVFMSLFALFGVQSQYQHRVLFWGIFGAIVMRFAFLFVGTTALHYFQWLLIPFGVLLLYIAWKLLKSDDEDVSELTEEERAKLADEKASNNPVVRWFKKFFPVTNTPHGQSFFVREGGKLVATPLFITLILVECSDLMFAFDSIPAVLAVSKSAFVLITSNIMAILGLRALYFVVESIMPMFRFLKHGCCFLLAFIGVKMILAETHIFHLETSYSLLIVLAALTVSIVASLIFREKKGEGHDTKSA